LDFKSFIALSFRGEKKRGKKKAIRADVHFISYSLRYEEREGRRRKEGKIALTVRFPSARSIEKEKKEKKRKRKGKEGSSS